jgi:hypothetical protein
MSDSCATCANSRVTDQMTYSAATNTTMRGPVRACHAAPPQVLPLGNTAWPIVGDDDWCGQFKAVPAP